MKDKIIFLDIDGVLNSNRYYTGMKHDEILARYDDYGDGFDPISRDLLNKLVKETGAKIVISSTWRLGGDKDRMVKMWKKRKMNGTIHGITPDFWQSLKPKDRNEADSISIPRGCEIKWYLENEFYFHHWSYTSQYVEEVKAKCTLDTYIILDDDADMLYEQRNNFVKCDSQFGFTEKEYNKAFLILSHGITYSA